MIYQVASGMNISLYLQGFQCRVDIILACSLENFGALTETASARCRIDQGQIDVHDDLEALQRHANSGLALIPRTEFCLSPHAVLDIYDKSFAALNLMFTSALCAKLLEDAASSTAMFGPRELSAKDRANHIRDFFDRYSHMDKQLRSGSWRHF
jgi:hypothetical protein